ncbi:DNA damage-binding protein 1 [Entamoeba marina]
MSDINSFFYFSSLSPPTAVSHSITARLANNSNYLIVAKLNLIEVYMISNTGLQPICNKQYSSSIETLLKYKPSEDNCEYLVVLTRTFELNVLKLTTTSLYSIIKDSVADSIGRASFFGPKVVISPTNHHMVLNLYEHLLKIAILPQHARDTLTAINVKVNHSRIIHLSYCNIGSTPHLAILHESKRDVRHLDTYTISDSNDLISGIFKQPSVGQFASYALSLPYPLSGLIVISESTICYFNGRGKHALVSAAPCCISAYCYLSKNILLLGDTNGRSHLLQFELDLNNEITQMNYKLLPKKYTAASTLSPLGGDNVFWGSQTGNSYLLKVGGNTYEEWKNYGSILDIKHLDHKINVNGDVVEQQNSVLISCNGGGAGSVGILSRGSGIEELGSLELQGIKHVNSFSFKGQMYIVLHLVESTLCCEIHPNNGKFDVRESKFPIIKGESLCCGVIDDVFVQVTPHTILAIDSKKHTVVTPKNVISHACLTKMCVYYITDNKLYKSESASKPELVLVLKEQPTCLYVGEYIGIGYWDRTVTLHTHQGELYKIYSLNNAICRSIYMDYSQLYIGCDGEVKITPINLMEGDDIDVFETVKINGTYPAHLHNVYSLIVLISKNSYTFQSTGLVPLAIENAVDICETSIGINGVCIATKQGLVVGSILPLSKCSFKTTIVGESINKMATIGNDGILLGNTIKHVDIGSGIVTNTNNILNDSEIALCVDGIDDMFFIGTAVVKENEVEPTSGRIIVIKYVQNKFVLIRQRVFDGAVYCLQKYQNGIAAIVNRHLLVIESNSDSLQTKGSKILRFIGVSMSINADYIIVGDLMKSISTYVYRPEIVNLDEVARDVDISWVTSVGVVPTQTVPHYISNDTSGNTFIYNQNYNDNVNSETHLNVVAQIHTGDTINVCSPSMYSGVMFAGVSGAVYNIAELTKEEYEFLFSIQKMLLPKEWRKVVKLHQHSSMRNIIDGDIIEAILDWNEKTQNCFEIGNESYIYEV